jgi:hypothetical protein
VRLCCLLLCVIALSSCRDEGAERYARARATYDSLLDRGELPTSKAFDPVLADLAFAQTTGAHAGEAKRLADAIRFGRSPHQPTPLALGAKPGTRPPELEAQLAACARLAQLAGADGGVARSRRPLRPPDQALEPEDEAVHLRRAQRHLHHRPAKTVKLFARAYDFVSTP